MRIYTTPQEPEDEVGGSEPVEKPYEPGDGAGGGVVVGVCVIRNCGTPQDPDDGWGQQGVCAVHYATSTV